MDCPFKYLLEYGYKLTPTKTPEYFTWGHFVHAGIEALAHGSSVEECAAALQKKTDDTFEAGGIGLETHIRQTYLLTLLPHVFDAYLLKWGDEASAYQIIAGEKEFALTLCEGMIFRGKIDKIAVCKKTGDMYVWEAKTPALTGEFYFSRLPLDAQIKGYMVAAQRVFGLNITQCLYDIIQKPTSQKNISPEKETADEFAERVGAKYLLDRDKLFHRRIITHRQETLDGYHDELVQVAQMVRESWTHSRWPKHHPGNRIGYCAYQDLCITGADQYDTSIYFTQREADHPELNGGAEEGSNGNE